MKKLDIHYSVVNNGGILSISIQAVDPKDADPNVVIDFGNEVLAATMPIIEKWKTMTNSKEREDKMGSTYKFSVPQLRYVVQAEIEGNTYTVTILEGETATPYFDPINRTVSWRVERPTPSSSEEEHGRI